MRSTLSVLALVVTAGFGVLAQHEHHGAMPSDKLGTVRFETTCNPSVQTDFNHGIALLHSFEFRPAIESFTRVLERDSSCAMAHWGIAMCQWSNPFSGIKSGPQLERGHAAATKGLSTGNPSPRERAYLGAVAELFKDTATVPHRDRVLAYARAMETVQREYPQDIEAHIFYALAVNQTALPTDKTYAAQLKAAGILEPLWQKYPDHPGLPHYIIHAYDHPPLAPKALEAARRYAKIAPAAPHALHMPSHTFTRVGYWKESAEANFASEQAAMKLNVMGEMLHAMDYQVYAYLQLAKDSEAHAIVRRMPGVLAKLDITAIGGAAPGAAGVYAGSAIPARYALERGAWAEAAALIPGAVSPFAHADAVTYFARALGAARNGTPAAAAADIDQLTALRDKLGTAKDEYWREQVDIQRRVATAWVTFAQGRRDEGIEQLRAAAAAEDATDKAAVSPGPLAPARELLGDMLLESGKAKEALVEFEATMKKEPGRFRGAYGAARAAEAAGDRTKARQYYSTLLEIAGAPGSTRPELTTARTAVGR
jgi:tetratricopeptide (TPR) repeat protein